MDGVVDGGSGEAKDRTRGKSGVLWLSCLFAGGTEQGFRWRLRLISPRLLSLNEEYRISWS